jgi:plastocyanin
MWTVRILAVSSLLMFATACGDSYSSSPASPSPVPSATPAPDSYEGGNTDTGSTPAPDGTPTAGGTSSSVTIPMGAENLGNRAYNPGEVSVSVGGTVTWVNTDRESHTSTSNAAGWDSGIISPGRQFSSTFPTAGTFPYHCAIHPGMVGTVVVR